MKTLKNNSLKVVTVITFFAVTLFMVGCNGQPNSKEEGSTSSSVSAPAVDIHTAVITGNIEALKQHIAAGTDINEKDAFGGSSPLISAAVFGKTEAAKVLIDAGADLNFQNKDGSTALISAAFFCYPDIVKMLLDNNADKTIKNKYGATAYASVAGPFDQVKGSYDMMKAMLGPAGLTLDYAYIEKTRPEIAEMLK